MYLRRIVLVWQHQHRFSKRRIKTLNLPIQNALESVFSLVINSYINLLYQYVVIVNNYFLNDYYIKNSKSFVFTEYPALSSGLMQVPRYIMYKISSRSIPLGNVEILNPKSI